jgi:hypothetical protein
LDFFRNYLLYHVSICDQNYTVDKLCSDGDTNRCLETIFESSETLSKLFDCPINKLGPFKAKLVKNCQLSRFLFLVFHQGLTLAFGKTNRVDNNLNVNENVVSNSASNCENVPTTDSSTRCRSISPS